MGALSSTLDSVTVYREGAVCRRIGTLPAGPERQFRLVRLPLSLEPASLRARVLDGGGRVVDVRAQFEVELAEEIDVPAEQKACEQAKDRLSQLEVQRVRLAAEIDELQSLRPAFLEPKRGEPPRAAPVDALLVFGDFAQAELSSRLARRRQLDQEILDARQEHLLRQRRLQGASTVRRGERARLTRVAVVSLAQPPSMLCELELEYRVPGARWVPS